MKFQPVLVFDTDSADFMRGFEAGRIWEALKADPSDMNGQLFHATNSEILMRMIDSLELEGLRAEFTNDPAWMVIRYD